METGNGSRCVVSASATAALSNITSLPAAAAAAAAAAVAVAAVVQLTKGLLCVGRGERW